MWERWFSEMVSVVLVLVGELMRIMWLLCRKVLWSCVEKIVVVWGSVVLFLMGVM